MRSYLRPEWQTVPLCPWLPSGETLRLSDVYTTLDMEFIEGRSSRQIQEYTELFEGIYGLKTGNKRILLQADPGMGKTLFTHKLALDWTEKRFTRFDLLLIVKLRHLAPDQPISHAITTQMKMEEEISPHDVEDHLIRSGENVLLVLDGLDEVDWKNYPQLKRILLRRDYPRCCVLATCKTHVLKQVSHYMTRVVSITGFSKTLAQKFVSCIIPDENKRYKFFLDLIERNMHDMYKIPRVLQVLAFMYDSGNKFSNTHTKVYDDLLLNVRKAYQGSKKLSDAEIDEAMNAVNELAFQALTQNKEQIVLPKEKIVNENIFELGILSATMFLHTSIDEFSTAGHVTRELKNGNRAPWELIKELYVDKLRVNEPSNSTFQIPLRPDVIDVESLTSATEKLVNNIIINDKGQVATIRRLLKLAISKGFLDDNVVDRKKLREICSLIPELDSFTERETKTTVNFLADFLSKLNREQKQKYAEMIIDFLAKDGTNWTYRWGVSDITKRLDKNPKKFTETMIAITQQIVSSGEQFTLQSVNPELLRLQHQANSMKSLFRFIMGKLRGSDMAVNVLEEIGQLLVTNAVDNNSGHALSVSFLKQYIECLMEEAGISSHAANLALQASDTSCNANNTAVPIPAVFCIKRFIPEFRESSIRSTALKLEDVTGSLSRSVELIDTIQYLTVVELYRIKQSEPQYVAKLADCLQCRPIVSVHLEELDIVLSKAVVNKLSPTALRLSLKEIPKTSDYRFPAEVNLRNVYIEESLSGVSQMFESKTKFTQLKSLSIVSKFTWSDRDLASLHAAAIGGRMPLLQFLAINHGSLRNRIKYILDMMEANTCQISTTDLEDTSLSTYDGKLLLAALRQRNIQQGHSLYLSRNVDLQPVMPQIAKEAEQSGVYIHYQQQYKYDGTCDSCCSCCMIL